MPARKAVPVFFQDQVEPLPAGEPTPVEPPRQPLTGRLACPPAAAPGRLL
jgi:hypothetical protein